MNCGIPDANRKARKLMHRMISANVMPKFLFINDVRTTFDTIGMGGYGRVFRGKYKGQPVALKVVDKGRKEVSSLPLIFSRSLSNFISCQGFTQTRLLSRSALLAITCTLFYPSSTRNI